ncbi:MAG: hypothetical protein PHH59_08620 [Methylovulum sp.]|uniref:hypothetical protein n=1 Tax=Methylovulum sp. TaxID=1916980 RepID=UPI0026195CBB|nr:hypothetical protein [Methylovulum sp.]MDD2724065.1 hypothetical protein [Methylovulum sp.]MDD5123829.1 hypothetical protein [Methylovulum sp.]
MKKLSLLLIALCCTTLVACNKGQVVNGHNMKTAYRSVKGLKQRMPSESRIEFEVAFWTVRDANKDESKFLDLVDGKKPEEIIAMGKEVYQERKNAGYKGYGQYSSWGEMITKFGRERMDQENRKSSPKADPRDKANDILYKL